MKRIIRNCFIILLPFGIILFVNEFCRQLTLEKPYSLNGVSAINSDIQTSEKCTWICHNKTFYCIKNHVKAPEQFVTVTSPIYFGVIHLLMATGNYRSANLLLFVVIMPGLITFFLLKGFKYRTEIKKIKYHGNDL